MFYQRIDPLPITRRLTREELRVFTACRSKVAFETIINKTRLEQSQVIKVINTFLAEGLMSKFNFLESSNTQKEISEQYKVESLPKKIPLKSDGQGNAKELLERLESILVARLPMKKVTGYIKQLRACSSEQELRAEARTISKKIALIVNASAGKELLSLLDY